MFNQYRPSGFLGLTPIVKNLLIINGLFFLATISVYKFTRGDVDLNQYLALYFPASDNFRTWQLVSYLFMHGNFGHLFFNMFALWMFGNVLEQVWGPRRFLTYYVITGIGAGIIHLLVIWYSYANMMDAIAVFQSNPGPAVFETLIRDNFSGIYNPEWLSQISNLWAAQPTNPEYIQQAHLAIQNLVQAKISIPTVGASGAVFGMLLAFGMLFPNSIIYLYFAIPIKAKYFVILYGAIELYFGIANSAGDNVAHFAHLGGMIFGFFMIKLWKEKY
ncbi:MAG: rhomboid family intramembrane serine protease [Bacteroidales bacterium]|nr:rhomboid family intramembrane serine protease [Bacteroidales bacterium]